MKYIKNNNENWYLSEINQNYIIDKVVNAFEDTLNCGRALLYQYYWENFENSILGCTNDHNTTYSVIQSSTQELINMIWMNTGETGNFIP